MLSRRKEARSDPVNERLVVVLCRAAQQTGPRALSQNDSSSTPAQLSGNRKPMHLTAFSSS